MVLAAGSGQRFAGPHHKLLAVLDGRTVVEHAVAAAVASGIGEVLVIAGAVSLPDSLTTAFGARVLHNPRWAQGQASSLAIAVDEADTAVSGGVVVGLGDQPSSSRRRGGGGRLTIADRRRHLRRPAAATRYGSSVRCGSCCHDQGDEGARAVIRLTARARGASTLPRVARRHRHRGGPPRWQSKIVNEFTVNRPIDEAWPIICDVERIAPCLPGAQLEEIEGDVYRGKVKVKLGAVATEFAGEAQFVERDDDRPPRQAERQGPRHEGPRQRRGRHRTPRPRRCRPPAPSASSPPTCTSPARSPSSAAA